MTFLHITLLLTLTSTMVSWAAEVDFNQQIRPILSDNCYFCHGPDAKKREANLRLDTFEGATSDLGGYAAINPGKPEASALLQRVHPKAGNDLMPPNKANKPPLTQRQRELLHTWIEQGAPYAGHWAFEPVKTVNVPRIDSDWTRNEIDQFILSKLEGLWIEPSPQADRETLLRRVTLDLTGLLPTPAQREAFLNDAQVHAYRQLVERLLQSPHYGERWGRHWLDQARYADSHGYSIDGDRDMWPYRDWVIQALNADMPFDQFTIEQLAGDLLPEPSKHQLIATAFHRNTLINQEGGSDPEQFRVEAVMDRVNTTGAVWLGLTVGCAQCHTHKFDPIRHQEYYHLMAFFNTGTDRNNSGKTIEVAPGEVFGEADKNVERKGKLMIMQEQDKPRDTYLLTRGDFTRPDKAAGVLDPGVIAAVAPTLPSSDKRITRLDLAKWLVHPDNPLTARVTINRTWMRYFGRGIVETEEDFGTQGSYPTHPQLLDWLASWWMTQGWSMKELHRLIVSSATYRQSSHARPDLHEQDPGNYYLARQTRLRLEGEIVRDAALAASGKLTKAIGGPSVRPPQPEGVYTFTQTKKRWRAEIGPNRYRRGLYTKFYRSAPYPLFGTFDAPDFQTVCTRRTRSNTPLQALTMANDPAFLELAQALAEVLISESRSLEQAISLGFLRTVSRKPTDNEYKLLSTYVGEQSKTFANDPEAARALLNDTLLALDVSPAKAAAAVCLARALFNTDNFITRE